MALSPELSPELRAWARRINWAVTTIEDCLGHQPGSGPPGWALYDADEDDPPIGEFAVEEDARNIAAILRTIAEAPFHIDPRRINEVIERYQPVLDKLEAYDRDEPAEEAGGWDW